MKTGLPTIALTTALAFVPLMTGAAEREAELKPQTTCPVMGGKINPKLYVDHDGQRIYVCCAGCLGPLQKDFAKYVEKLGEQSQAPARLQAKCPVMGGKINPKLYVDHDAQRIYVCCAGCTAPLRKDFAKYAEKLRANGVVVADTPKAAGRKQRP